MSQFYIESLTEDSIFRPRKFASNFVISAAISRSSHCQTIITFQFFSLNNFMTRRSRALFCSNLAVQNSLCVAGVEAYLQPGWRCQKHPWTKITARYLGNTISGEPGKSLACNRKRYPMPCRSERTCFSGLVFVLRTRDMFRNRCSGVKMSIFALFFMTANPFKIVTAYTGHIGKNFLIQFNHHGIL